MRTYRAWCLVVLAVIVFEHTEVKAAPRPLISLPLKIFLVDGLQISYAKVDAAINEAIMRIKEELHITIRRIGQENIEDINPGRNIWNWSNELLSWNLKLRSKRQLRMIVAPAVKGNGVEYTAGLGWVCFYKTYALSEVFTKESFDDGLDSFMGITNIMEHELGHQLGALHDDSRLNVMHPNSTKWGQNYRLSFSDKSKREIRKCLRGLRK